MCRNRSEHQLIMTLYVTKVGFSIIHFSIFYPVSECSILIFVCCLSNFVVVKYLQYVGVLLHNGLIYTQLVEGSQAQKERTIVTANLE